MNPDRLVRLHPYVGSPRVPARVIGTPEVTSAAKKAISAALEARAASCGLKKVDVSRASVTRLLGGATPKVIDSNHLVTDLDTGGLPESRVAQARRKAAKNYREASIRRLHSEESKYRQARIFSREGRPATFVWWNLESDLDSMVEFITENARLAAAFDLDFHWAAPYPCVGTHWLGLEICRPGCSVFEGWKFGDLAYCGPDDDPYEPDCDGLDEDVA